jgi:gamma-glutamyltranspeptidase/glutathione hydrolase
LLGLNAAGRAPGAATTDWYARSGITSIATQSPHAVTVPGAIAGWTMLLADHGTKSLAEVLAPAIELAEGGYVVAPRVAYDWANARAKIDGHAGARQHLLKDGRVPKAGEIMRFPALARTLAAIARDGRDAFYTGEIAADMVATLKELGGLHTLDDFAAQNATYVEPIATAYGGLDVYQLPPSNQGVTGLIMLNILKHLPAYPDAKAGSAQREHLLIEAARLAYAVRDRYVADPDYAKVPVAGMLADDYAAALAKRIDPKRRTAALGPMPKPDGSDTIYLTVADGSGMMVSFINSLFADFGSGIVAPKSGVTLHNRGQGFRLEPDHPSAIAPGKRPMHTIIPAFATKNGVPYMSFGVMGGQFQPMGHVYVTTAITDLGQDPQEALDAPRLFFEGDTISLEHSVPGDVEGALAEMGHRCVRRPSPWGGGQIIVRDAATGVYAGASDPRKDGIAVGY